MADPLPQAQRRFKWGDVGIGRFTPSVVLVVFLPIVALFALTTYLNSRVLLAEVQSTYQVPSILERAKGVAELMLSDVLEEDEPTRILALGAKVALIKQDPTIDYVVVCAADGNSLYDSEAGPARSDKVLAREVREKNAPFIRSFYNRGRYEYVVPIARRGTTVGFLRVGYSRESLARPFEEAENRIWLNVLAVLAAVTAVLFLSASWITRPFRQIVSDFTRVIARQNLSSRVPETGFGEVRLLQRAYNKLKDALEDMQTSQQLLGKYVSPKVAEMVLDGKLDVVPKKTRITVLYIDIENFTDYTAYHEVDNVTTMVSEFWEIVEDAVQEFDGTVDKHVGDAVICMWNAPLPQPDAAARAVRCLFAIEAKFQAWNVEREINRREPIRTWSSIATGSCIVGNLGRRRMEFTALGNTMNIAPRIMTKAHELNARRTIDRFTYEQVSDFVVARDLGEHALRGVRGPIRIYELVSLRESPSAAPVAEKV